MVKKFASEPTEHASHASRLRLRRLAFAEYGTSCYLCGNTNEAELTLRFVRDAQQLSLGNDQYSLYRNLRQRSWPAKAMIRVACKSAACRDAHNTMLKYKRIRFAPPKEAKQKEDDDR